MSRSKIKLNMTRPTRRTLVVVSVAALLAACAGGGDAQSESGDDQDAIRIGILAPYTGVFAAFGENVIEAPIRLYLEQNGNEIAGRPVELVTADDQSEAELEVRKARELVEREDVDVIIGLVNSAGALAVRDYLDEEEVLTFITVAGAEESTGSRKSDWIFRAGFSNGQMAASGAVLAEEAGIESLAAIGADYVAGHEHVEPMVEMFQELGGEVPKVLWSPLGTPDFSPYLTELGTVTDQVDAVMPLMYGADANRFFQQYSELGLEAPIYTFGNVTEQTIFIDQAGEAAVGAKTYYGYSPYLDNEENNAFRESYLEAYDRLPGGLSMHAWAAMQFYDSAVSEVGDPDAKGEIKDALESAEIDSPSGPLRFDENHSLIFTVYLNEIKEGPDGIIAQVPMGPRVTNVGQNQTLEEAQSNLESGS